MNSGTPAANSTGTGQNRETQISKERQPDDIVRQTRQCLLKPRPHSRQGPRQGGSTDDAGDNLKESILHSPTSYRHVNVTYSRLELCTSCTMQSKLACIRHELESSTLSIDCLNSESYTLDS